MPKKESKKNPKKDVSKSEKKVLTEKLPQEEYEKKVLELAERGMTAEKIGEYLRKQGIHPKEYDKKISKILKEKGKYTPPDIVNLSKKLEKIEKHCEKNKQDKRAMRERDRILSNLRKLKEYYNF